MQEFKIGGKITLEDNTSYRIVDIVKYKGKDYLFCCTVQGKIEPKVFERKIENDKTYVCLEEDPEILKMVSIKVLKNE